MAGGRREGAGPGENPWLPASGGGEDGPVTTLPEPPVLRDGDLLLRAHRPEDAEGVYERCQDPETVLNTTIPHPYSRQDADEFVALTQRWWREDATAAFAIEVDGRYAGSIDLRLEEGAWAEVGYVVSPWARGRGVMTRALRLALGWGFDELGLAGVRWEARVGNEASRRVAQRCGFALEGTVRGLLVHRGERLDGWIGSLLRDDPRG